LQGLFEPYLSFGKNVVTKRLPAHWAILIALALGIAWALASAALGWSAFTSDWIAPFGEIFLRLLKMIAVPLVAISVVRGVCSLHDVRTLGILGARTLALYVGTTALAVTLGLVLVNVIAPGEQLDAGQRQENRASYEAWRSGAGVDGFAASGSTSPLDAKVKSAQSVAGRGPLQVLVDIVPENVVAAVSASAMLPVIVASILFGIAMMVVPADRVRTLREVIEGLDAVLLALVTLVMRAAPFFVFCLLAGTISAIAGNDVRKVLHVFEGLSWYGATVLLGLALMAGGVYPLLAKLFRPKLKLGWLAKGIGPAQALAFSTSSSAATLPATISCVQNNLGVSERVAGFVLPIGATINMDGTSLYQAVAVVFLAQFHMIDLSLQQQLTIVLTASLASIGAAAVPSAGLVTLVLVMQSVGLNPAWIAVIIPVDRILDMCRTVVNVTGDAVVSVIVDGWDKRAMGDKL